MSKLLGQMRRERNGAVADAMAVYGRGYGLNYGVSLATVRAIAAQELPDHAFARFLMLQDVRELRLVALQLADPIVALGSEQAEWQSYIVNSELAEQAAFALLGRSRDGAWFDRWIASPEELVRYAALLAGARSEYLTCAWIAPVCNALRGPVTSDYAPRLLAQGAVALLAAAAAKNHECRQEVLRMTATLDAPAADYLREELAWRLEC